MKDLVDLESERSRRKSIRVATAMTEDEARWDRSCDQLLTVLTRSGLSTTGMASTGLRALLEVLMDIDDLSCDEAKALLAARLPMFDFE